MDRNYEIEQGGFIYDFDADGGAIGFHDVGIVVPAGFLPFFSVVKTIIPFTSVTTTAVIEPSFADGITPLSQAMQIAFGALATVNFVQCGPIANSYADTETTLGVTINAEPILTGSLMIMYQYYIINEPG